ncbi:hypothetical protein, partial [uncultured Maribacter sp.]
NVTAEFNLTQVGSYTFRITDTNTGCYIDTAPYDIAQYDLIEVTAALVSDATCSDSSNGEMSIQINNYTGNYSYQIFDNTATAVGGIVNTDTSVNPRTLNGLAAGIYYVEITATDSPFCDDTSNTVTIDAPEALALSLVSNVNANCI